MNVNSKKHISFMKKIVSFLLMVVIIVCFGCEKPKDARVTSITLREKKMEVHVGSTSSRIKYIIEPEELQNDVVVTWSSENENIATVDDRGRVTGVAEGRTKVWAKCDTVSASLQVIVTSLPVEDFMIQESMVIPRDNVDTLKVTDIEPVGGDISTIKWEILDKEIAKYTIEKDYLLIEGLKEGSTKIIGKCDTIERVCNIMVEYFEVEGISISADVSETYVGGSIKLQPIFTPANASNQSLTWEVVSGEECISFNEKTLEVKALKEGIATIKATTYNGISDEIEVVIMGTGVAKIELTHKDSEIYENLTTEVTAKILPSIADTAKLTWSIECSSYDGGYTTITPSEDTHSAIVKSYVSGEITVRATAANGVTGECKINVIKPVLTSLTLKEITTEKSRISPDGSFGINSKTLQLEYSYTPNIEGLRLYFSSLNSSVASVDKNGLVTAKGHGVAPIVVTAYGMEDTILVRSYKESEVKYAASLYHNLWPIEYSYSNPVVWSDIGTVRRPVISMGSVEEEDDLVSVSIYDEASIFQVLNTSTGKMMYYWDDEFTMNDIAPISVIPENASDYSDWKEPKIPSVNSKSFSVPRGITFRDKFGIIPVNWVVSSNNISQTITVEYGFAGISFESTDAVVDSNPDRIFALNTSANGTAETVTLDLSTFKRMVHYRMIVAYVFSGSNLKRGYDNAYAPSSGWKSEDGTIYTKHRGNFNLLEFDGTPEIGKKYKMINPNFPGRYFYIKFVE